MAMKAEGLNAKVDYCFRTRS